MYDQTINYNLANISIRNFANANGLKELTYLPINIVDTNNPPAYTTPSGIYVSQEVIEHEPHNAIVYVMHEIMHHVVHNSKETYSFHPRVVNVAEDYLINYLLVKIFGLDVRTVKFRGIFSKKHALAGLRMSCEMIVKKSGKRAKNERVCSCMFTVNPVLDDLANKLKMRLRIKIEQALYFRDIEDQRAFDRVRGDFSGITSNLPIDVNSTLFSMFLKLFNPSVTPVPSVGSILTPSEAMANFLEASKVRKYTVGSEEMTSLVILNIFQYLQFSHANAPLFHRKYSILKKEAQLALSVWSKRLSTNSYRAYFTKYKTRYTKTEVKKLIKKLKKRIHSLTKSISKWEYRCKHPLNELLYKYPIKIRKPKTLYSANTLNKVGKIARDKDNEIEVIPNIATKELRSYLRGGLKRALLSIECYKDITDLFEDLVKPEEENTKKPLKDIDLDDLKSQFPEDIDNTGEEGEGEGEDIGVDGENGIEGNSEDNGKSEGSSGKPDKKDKAPGGEGQEDEDKELPDLNKKQDIKSPSFGGGTGNSKSVPQLLSSLPVTTLKSLANILKYADMFETRLNENKNKKIDDNESIALIPSRGNDLSVVSSAELSLLHHPATEMLFYSKLAQHSLDIIAPIQNKLDAIVVAIDNSGSMKGKCYEVATGFSLALMKKLATSNREGALLSFSSSVNGRVIIKKNHFSILDILNVLLAPEYGGTNFDAPMLASLKMKEDRKWKSMTYLLVTDGGGGYSEECRNIMRQKKTSRDRYIAVGTVHSASHLQDSMDEVVKISSSGAMTELIKVGNRIL